MGKRAAIAPLDLSCKQLLINPGCGTTLIQFIKEAIQISKSENPKEFTA